jgi:hypothetical protein
LYCSPNIFTTTKSRSIEIEGYVALWGRRGMYIGNWWESQKERPPERTRCKWVNNILMGLRETGWDGMEWIDLAAVTE